MIEEFMVMTYIKPPTFWPEKEEEKCDCYNCIHVLQSYNDKPCIDCDHFLRIKPGNPKQPNFWIFNPNWQNMKLLYKKVNQWKKRIK